MNQDCLGMSNDSSRIFADVKIDGEIKSERSMDFKGIIQGNVDCKQVLSVGKEAVINGKVTCGDLWIEGKVRGDVVVVNTTVMGEEAEISGKLITGRLKIKEGAKIGNGLVFRKNV